MKRYALLLLFFFLCIPLCFASMTIFLKDGTSREVHKISFKGQQAELYLVDGAVITVPVEKIDLPSSGIGAPVGTYGQTRVTRGVRPTVVPRPLRVGDPMRQVNLKKEWESAEETAVALNNIGSIRRGDTVKIVGETNTSSSSTAPNQYEEYDDYYYDSETGRYYKYRNYRYQDKALNKDHAYVVLYQNPDGTFSKRLFDAATFSENFKLNRQQVVKTAPPILPRSVPETPSEVAPPEIKELIPGQNENAAKSPAPEVKEPAPAQTPAAGEQKAAPPVKKKSSLRFLVALGFLLALAAVLFLLKKKTKPLVDTSNFEKYEEDLREFEIAIWLRNGKTMDQLMEICLKKFYQDNPEALSISMKMLKGGQKNWILPLIIKQTGTSSTEAEELYFQIQARIDRVRSLIQEVSQRTGAYPTQPVSQTNAVTTTQKTEQAIPSLPPVVTSQPDVSRSSMPVQPRPAIAESKPHEPPASGTSSVVNKPAASLIEPDQPLRRAADLPAYANNLLSQIGFLSGSDEK